MNCRDMDLALIEHGKSVTAQLPAHAQEHLMACERCQELVRALDSSRGAETPSPETLRQLERGLAVDLRPVRPLAPRRYFLAAFAAIFLLIVAIGVYRLGAFAISVMSPAQAIATLCALASSAGVLTYSLVQQMVPGSRHRIPPHFVPPAVMILLVSVVAGIFQFQHEQNFWRQGWACFRAGTPFSLVAALPFWLLLRRGAILSPRIAGAAAGLLAGLVGTSALEIHCPILDASHILMWHVGVALIGAVIGFAAGFAGEMAGRSARSGHRGQSLRKIIVDP
jgi:hypothetical protein